MGFSEVSWDKETVDKWEKELKKNGQVSLHRGETPKRERFWWVRLLALVVLPTLLAVPLFLYTFIQAFLKQKKSVKGKVVLITGAGRGLGRIISIKFAALGAHVACVDINTETVKETVKLIQAAGGKAAAFTTNIAKPEQVTDLKKDVEKALGPVEILVNNAAIVTAIPVSEWNVDQIRAFYDVNILSHLWMIKTFLPTMRERKSGHIVTMSSAAALMPCPYLGLYGSSKAAISSLANIVREEMEMLKEPIKFTTLHPIFINTSVEVAGFCDLRIPTMDEEDASSEIVNAILLEKENVALPGYFWNLAIFDTLFPKIFHKLSMLILSPKICIPDKKFRNNSHIKTIMEDTLNKKFM